MAPSTVWYFAYGSNLNRAVMESRAGRVLEAQVGRLENYELLFNKKVRGGSGEANIQPARGKTVYGALYKVTDSALRILDRATGAPVHYRRIEVGALDQNGNKVNAQVYIASKVEKGLRPASQYLQTILDGAAQFALPEEYIALIKKAAGLTANGNGRPPVENSKLIPEIGAE
jgi:cation transport regulator ChaC